MVKEIKRDYYLEQLIKREGNGLIKIVEDMISIISKTNIFDELVEKIKQDENLKVL